MLNDIGLDGLISRYQQYPDYCRYSNLSEAERYSFIREYLSHISRAHAGELITDALNDNRHFFTCFFQSVCDKEKKPAELLNIILSCVDQFMSDTFAAWFDHVKDKRESEIKEEFEDVKSGLTIVKRCA